MLDLSQRIGLPLGAFRSSLKAMHDRFDRMGCTMVPLLLAEGGNGVYGVCDASSFRLGRMMGGERIASSRCSLRRDVEGSRCRQYSIPRCTRVGPVSATVRNGFQANRTMRKSWICRCLLTCTIPQEPLHAVVGFAIDPGVRLAPTSMRY
jgi:hypothetical protein